jgi:hypothetical protein
MSQKATYPLSEIHRLLDAGRIVFTNSSVQAARALEFDQTDIQDCVRNLKEHELHKTMPANKVPGLFQDVYYTEYDSVQLYVKLQIARDSRAVVISFQRNKPS